MSEQPGRRDDPSTGWDVEREDLGPALFPSEGDALARRVSGERSAWNTPTIAATIRTPGAAGFEAPVTEKSADHRADCACAPSRTLQHSAQ